MIKNGKAKQKQKSNVYVWEIQTYKRLPFHPAINSN